MKFDSSLACHKKTEHFFVSQEQEVLCLHSEVGAVRRTKHLALFPANVFTLLGDVTKALGRFLFPHTNTKSFKKKQESCSTDLSRWTRCRWSRPIIAGWGFFAGYRGFESRTVRLRRLEGGRKVQRLVINEQKETLGPIFRVFGLLSCGFEAMTFQSQSRHSTTRSQSWFWYHETL